MLGLNYFNFTIMQPKTLYVQQQLSLHVTSNHVLHKIPVVILF